jgi:hypothetical protein
VRVAEQRSELAERVRVLAATLDRQVLS